MTVIFVIAGAAAFLVAALLAIVVAGIRREPAASELSATAPSLTAGIVRRALGVSVRKPDADEHSREACLIGQGPSGWREGQDQ